MLAVTIRCFGDALEGHEWEATPQNVHVRKSWCPHCYGNCPFAIEDLQKLAASRGGDLLLADAPTDHQFFDGDAAQATNGKIQLLTLCVVLGVPFAVGRSEIWLLEPLIVSDHNSCYLHFIR